LLADHFENERRAERIPPFSCCSLRNDEDLNPPRREEEKEEEMNRGEEKERGEGGGDDDKVRLEMLEFALNPLVVVDEGKKLGRIPKPLMPNKFVESPWREEEGVVAGGLLLRIKFVIADILLLELRRRSSQKSRTPGLCKIRYGFPK
jgi:hypothetical protein